MSTKKIGNKFWECAHRDVSERRARDTKGAKRPPQAELVSAEEAGAIA
jgi:hypothetical protein